ncbi:hypothetical protein [Sporosarcina psychrophila]|uniref:Uncharacterized protein n=1 Tax=Sporosarcina psychrophila TaxID=1476 RepID=A0ABV2K5S0_SPOPS
MKEAPSHLKDSSVMGLLHVTITVLYVITAMQLVMLAMDAVMTGMT